MKRRGEIVGAELLRGGITRLKGENELRIRMSKLGEIQDCKTKETDLEIRKRNRKAPGREELEVILKEERLVI